jgi:alpha-L-fucosidase
MQKGFFLGIVLAAVFNYAVFSQQYVLPSPQQVLWQEMEQIMFLCLDPCTWQGRELDNHSTPLSCINPTKLDVNQWIDAAEAFDAKMILFVAKHTGGFCWWQTETTDYSIKNTPYKNGKGDVLDELAKACFVRGIKLGVYIYPGDETWGAYVGGGGKTKDPALQEGYNKVLRRQWEEVTSRYGKQITEIWFDGSIVIPLEDIILKNCPTAIVFQGPFANIRWVGNERGIGPYPNWYTVKAEDAKTGVATAEHGDPDGDVWMPVEVNTVPRYHYWFWSTANHKSLRSFDEMMDIYYQSVGRGGLFLLNAAPDTTGLIPELDMELYRDFGKEIRRRFGKSIAETAGKGNKVELHLKTPTLIDHVIIQEDIEMGQRVRRYSVEGLKNGKWTTLASGLSVGQKRIERFAPVKVKAVRLRVTESSYPPVIKRLAIFHTGISKERLLSSGEKLERNTGELPVSSNGSFEYDVSPYIPMAEQYILSVKAEQDTVKFSKLSLWLQGVETPGFATILADGTARINITAMPDMKKGSIVIKGELENKPAQPCKLFIK